MHIGKGNNTSDLDDFNLMPEVNMARLVNRLNVASLTASVGEPGGIPSQAVERVASFVRAHQQSFPARVGQCRWASLEALLTHVRHSGPNCSADDVAAAIAWLPAPQTQAGNRLDAVI